MMSVAPFMGAWIETRRCGLIVWDLTVAPFMGAWIETSMYGRLAIIIAVAPFMGAWIETSGGRSYGYRRPGRTLHGCVD